MGDNDDERARQRRQARQIKDKDLHASDNEDDDIQKEQEDEEVEVEEETSVDLETGVPASGDDPKAPAREDRTGGKGTADSPKLDTPTKKQISKVTVGSVIDKLNALRGGRSLKDPKVRKSFDQYFNALSKGQRETLLVFLTGVSQILAGVAQGDEALEPDDVGLETNTVKTKEKVVKKKVATSEKERPGTEMQPIVVGEGRKRSAARASIKHAIKAYKRNK